MEGDKEGGSGGRQKGRERREIEGGEDKNRIGTVYSEDLETNVSLWGKRRGEDSKKTSCQARIERERQREKRMEVLLN